MVDRVIEEYGEPKLVNKFFRKKRYGLTEEQTLQLYHRNSYFVDAPPKRVLAIKERYNEVALKMKQHNDTLRVTLNADLDPAKVKVSDSLRNCKKLVVDLRLYGDEDFGGALDVISKFYHHDSAIAIVYPKRKVKFTRQGFIKKVAILVGPKTAMGGEVLAAAFLGRPGCRIFGSRTAGFLSAVGEYKLGKRVLRLTIGDLRTEKSVIPEAITPKHPVSEAMTWLS